MAENQKDDSHTSNMKISSVVAGGIVGFGLGAVIGGIIWFINSDNRTMYGFESLPHYAGQVGIGLAITEAIIGGIGRMPELTGFVSGTTIMVLSAIVFEGRRGGWVFVWIIGCGMVGLILGPILGLVMRLLGCAK
jgi:hypothetical protein